ncbi:hypothetical protein D3C73_1673970 [compost metagenome]
MQLIRYGSQRLDTDADFIIRVTTLDTRGEMTVSVQIIAQSVQRSGKNAVRAFYAFPLLTADLP